MRNRNRIFIFAGIFAVIIVLFILFRQGTPKRYNWLETYKETSKQPYGTLFIKELLRNYFPEDSTLVIEQKLSDELPVDSTEHIDMNYVFIGEGLYMDSLDVATLLEFVENGHTAFISSKSIPYDLMFYLYFDECNDIYWDDYTYFTDSTKQFNFLHPSLKRSEPFEFSYEYHSKVKPYNWHYISDYYFCDQDFGLTALGDIEVDSSSLINFARIRYGAGFFYLHTTPIIFSNIKLLEGEALDYTNRIFSHLKEGPIFWDAYSRISEATSRRRNRRNSFSPDRSISNKSPLEYILSQPPLKMAWYTLILATLLYLIFMAKRRQRVIPVLPKNSNTSLEFLKTIGSLYFLQNDHKQLSVQKMRLFKSFVKEKYNITLKEFDDKTTINRLVQKSEIPEDKVVAILSMYRNIETSSFVSENTLIDFHKKTDQFYKNCK